MFKSLRRARRALALAALPLACCAPVFAIDDALTTGTAGGGIMSSKPGAGIPSAPEPETPIAKVNGKTIYQRDLDAYRNDFLGRQLQAIQQQGGRPSPQDIQAAQAQLMKTAKADVIKQTAGAEAIEVEKAKVKDSEIEPGIKATDALLQAVKHTTLADALKQNNQTMDDVRQQYRQQKAVENLVEREMGVKPPTEDEVKSVYEKNKEHFLIPELVHASHVLIMFDSTPRDGEKYVPPTEKEKAAKKKQAEEVLAKARGGEDFAKLAKEFSGDKTNKDEGGDLGYFDRRRMTRNFADAAFNTKQGQISDVVETEFGYHVLKVADHTSTKTLSYEQIRFKLEQDLMTPKIQEAVPGMLTKLAKQAKIEMLDGSKKPDFSEAPKPAAPAEGAAPPSAPPAAE